MTMRSRWILLPLAALAAILIVLAILFDWNWFKGPLESVASAALGRDVEIAGDLEVDLAVAPTITLEQVRVANAEWGSRPNMLAIPRLAFALDLGQLLRGAIALPFLRVQEPDLLLETNRQGEATGHLGPPDKNPGAPPLPIIEDLQIAAATVRYREPGRKEDLVAALEHVNGALTSSGAQVNAGGTLNEEPLSLRLASAPVAQLEAAAQRFPFELDAELGSTRLAATGSAEAPLQAQGLSVEITLDSQDPGALLALAGREARDPGDLHLALSLTSQDQIWTVPQINLRLGQSDLRGRAEVQLGKPEPLIAAELASDQIRLEDLAAFLPENAPEQPSGPGPEGAVDAATAEAKAALADDEQGADGAGGFRLPTDMLPRVDGEVSYTVGRSLGPELALTDLDLHARLEDGLPRLELTGGGDYENTPVALDVQLGGTEQPTVDLSEQRPFIRADLQSKRLVLSDLITAGGKAAMVEVDEAVAAANA